MFSIFLSKIDAIKLSWESIVVVIAFFSYFLVFVHFWQHQHFTQFADYPQSVQRQNTHLHSNHEPPNHSFKHKNIFFKKRIKIANRIGNFSRAKWSSVVSFKNFMFVPKERIRIMQAKSKNKKRSNKWERRAFRCS